MLLPIKLYDPDQLDIQIYLDTICSYLLSSIVKTYWISRYTWIKYVFTYKALWSRSTGYSDIPGYNILLSITIIQIYWIQYFVIYNHDSNLLDIQIYLDTICCFFFFKALWSKSLDIRDILLSIIIIQIYWISRYTWIQYVVFYKALWSKSLDIQIYLDTLCCYL